MDWLISFITAHAQYAPWIIFCALMLAGLNVPISEDLMLIFSGVLASTLMPERTWVLFVAVFFGAYLSDWVAYWIGRKLGPALWRIPLFARVMRPSRVEAIRGYYLRYGGVTLLIGRFIPFGVRNCLFMSAGLVRMPFLKFLLFDGIACLISNCTVFWLSYACGKNYRRLQDCLEVIDIVIFVAFTLAIIAFVWYKKSKKVTT